MRSLPDRNLTTSHSGKIRRQPIGELQSNDVTVIDAVDRRWQWLELDCELDCLLKWSKLNSNFGAV